MARTLKSIYPDYSAELAVIEKDGISPALLNKIIKKHKANANYNRELYWRYSGIEGYAPIDKREPRFEKTEVNNKIRSDFFGEIVDFKTGYFAGKPIAYSYSKTEESQRVTGGEAGVEKATKAVTDFVTRNNMYGVDMETTKLASIYGYVGRLFYIDPEGEIRVMTVPAYQTIILSEKSIAEPKYAIRYYCNADIDGNRSWTVEFYDNEKYYTYTGSLGSLEFRSSDLHMFDYCPFQGVANNEEMIGDAEKVLSEIDAYDKIVSDNVNEFEGFVHAYMVFEGLVVNEQTIREANKTGAFTIPPGGTGTRKISFLTKDVNDEFSEHQLDRLEDNIYRFSKTPNLNDEAFGTASGVALKFKLNGLNAKCGMFQSKMMDAAVYMWKLLASHWAKKSILVDPLQVTMEFSRDFPLDTLSNAQAAQALIAAGLPKEVAWTIAVPEIDDIDYVLQLVEAEKSDIPPITADNDDNDTDGEGEE